MFEFTEDCSLKCYLTSLSLYHQELVEQGHDWWHFPLAYQVIENQTFVIANCISTWIVTIQSLTLQVFTELGVYLEIRSSQMSMT